MGKIAEYLSVKMEKIVKYLSITATIMLILFIAAMFTAATMSVNGNEGTVFNILYYTSQTLMYMAPAVFLASFGLGIYCIIKRRKMDKSRKEIVKFPIVWFIISSVIFIIVLVFIILIISMEFE